MKSKALRILVTEEIRDEEVRGRDGRSFRIRNQAGHIYGRSDLGLVPFRVRLGDHEPAYSPGVYELSGESVDVDGNGGLRMLQFGRLELVMCSPEDPAARQLKALVSLLEGAGTVESGARAKK